ncbi:hypothetical protein AK830_g7838 [Neonectria ditissima]|uniref:Uncharacterized protein n=1 Tax=Neonectria ditissima TaxID=78410 RepID=A0A0P7B9A1_9HYPO|nr:hypothetical protein AK830_g7838 [Neonectria ditissima]
MDSPPPYERVPNPDVDISIPKSSIGVSSAELRKLIAIPATTSKLGSPFLRAYPPALDRFGISCDVFLEFIDHLNRVAVASPPVQVLSLAGNIVGMVPLQTAQIVGGVVNAAATLTTVAMSKGRVEMLLRQVNHDVFGPRRLQARIAKLDAVAKIASIPILDDRGKINDESPILAPLEDVDGLHSLSAQQRRIASLEPWISPLQIESLPEVDRPENPFSRMHAAVSEGQRKKEEKKMKKNRQKAQEGWIKDTHKAREEYEEELSDLAREENKVRTKNSRHMDRDLQRIERKRQKAIDEYEEEMRKAGKDRQKDDKEQKMMRKILFLIVEKIEA